MNSVPVYLGSNNPIKCAAVEEVFSKEKGYQVISIDIKSGVSNQPKTIEETILGAISRAKNIEYNGIKIGLEAGVAIISNICYLINFGVMIDDEGNTYYAGGTFIPLDKEMSDLIYLNNIELKDAVNMITNISDINKKEGTIGLLTNNQVKRNDIFVHICKLLLGQMQRRRNL